MQENKIKISIIVPVYNVEKYLEKCLDSIQAQTYSNLEVILIEDGSTDESASICRKYVENDSRFQLIEQKNKGASAARNRGLERATGEYIGFVDSDDWIDTDMYQKLLEIAQKEQADIVCCAYRHVKKEQVIESADDSYYVFQGREMFQEYIRGKNGCFMAPAVWNRLFRRKIFEKIRFTEGRMFEDKEISCKTLLSAQKGIYYNHAFYNYRDNKDSVSNMKITPKYVSDFIYMYRVQDKLVERYLNEKYHIFNTGIYYMLLLDMYCRTAKDTSLKQTRRKMSRELRRIFPLAKTYIMEQKIPSKDKKLLLLSGISRKMYYRILQLGKKAATYKNKRKWHGGKGKK